MRRENKNCGVGGKMLNCEGWNKKIEKEEGK